MRSTSTEPHLLTGATPFAQVKDIPHVRTCGMPLYREAQEAN